MQRAMSIESMKSICAAFLIAVIGMAGVEASAAKAKPAPTQTPLTETSQKLQERYSAVLSQLKADISHALPTVADPVKSAYLHAREEEKAAKKRVEAAEQAFGDLNKAKGLVGHAHWWINSAEKEISQAQAKLKQATADALRKAAQESLTKAQARRDAGVGALTERETALAKAKTVESQLNKELNAAREALTQTQARTLKAFDSLDLESFLSSDKLDGQLVKFIVLTEATAHGLAEFAQQGAAQEKLLEQLLSDSDLMMQMVVADGANGGKYGRAMEIYSAILQTSPKAKEGVFQRLALAVSLEFAVPLKQQNPESQADAPATVDPVKRYQSYEKAYLNGELDPAFATLSVWEYRMVVDGLEPDQTLAWGREMLGNYRPDLISMPDYRWRYVKAVATEIRYGSQDCKFDRPDLQVYQNILMNGGVCGRRAFFGRFILRAFGIPTLARPQKGHAALAHWTPEGWVVFLGAGWGSGWTKTRYNKDLDFLAMTQARSLGKPFLEVQRAQWIGTAVGEKPTYGFLTGDPGFWNSVALYEQREMIQKNKAVALAAVGEDIGEANESKEKDVIQAVSFADADRKVVTGNDGTITIPAAACSKPTTSTGKILFMPSNLGGKQLHYSRNGKAEDFEYTFDAPAAGKYALTARVVTPSWKQHLLVATNGTTTPTDIALPFTVGAWEKTQPVEIDLVKGPNLLRFSRTEPVNGLSIKDFVLTPVN